MTPLSKETHPGVNWDFIRQLEGWESKGYVPRDRDKDDKVPSGVTIAAGFDIGQQSPYSITKFGFSKPLLDKVKPYAGLTGDKAREALRTTPLKLTKEELTELDTKVKEVYYKSVQKQYDAHSDFTFMFLDTPKQTVICSVAFQYGDLKRRCPRFFDRVTKGMWQTAVAELRDFGDGYKSRRLKEADYLESSLKG